MSESNSQQNKFTLTIGASGYRSRSDASATDPRYLVSGSQNVLINEATDEGGDKIESRAGYELKGATSSDRNKIKSEFVFKTKAGNTVMGRMDDNGDVEYYSEQSEAWETLLTGLDGDYPMRWTSVWDGAELLRLLLFVNHSSVLYDWSGAFGTLDGDVAITATTITINETIATAGFLSSGATGAKIRIKDSGGTWREATVSSHSGKVFTVSTDLTSFTFSDNAIVVQSVRTNSNTPASGFTNDTIRSLQNHVYVGSHDSSVVYMSQSDDFTDYTFSSPRLPGEGWQFLMDAFNIGFETNIAGSGLESMVFFAGDNWIYRVEFNQLGDTSIVESASIKPIIVSSGQGAIEQELISKVGNSIIFINAYNELVELGQFESQDNLQQVPLSDPIKPDFLAATFTGGDIRFWRNNLYITAPVSGKMFILSFRDDQRGVRRFWQPPQTIPVGQTSDYNGNLIGHSNSATESYTLFTGTNDNGQAIIQKAHFAYHNYGNREKLKNFDKYFTEMYLTENAEVMHKLVFEYLGAKNIKEFSYFGTESTFIFTPNVAASLGVNALGTSPLGGALSEPTNLKKYRRFNPIVPIDFFEVQVRYECENLDGRFQLLCHGPNAEEATSAPSKITT